MNHSISRDLMDLNLRDEYRKFRPTLATRVWTRAFGWRLPIVEKAFLTSLF